MVKPQQSRRALRSLLVLVLATFCSVASAAATPPSNACSAVTMSMADCLSYVESGSTTAKPTGLCCTGLKTVIGAGPQCLCDGLAMAGSMGIKLNMTRAAALPDACGVKVPPLHCSAAAASPSPAPGPAKPTPGASPVPATSPTPSPSKAPAPAAPSPTAPSPATPSPSPATPSPPPSTPPPSSAPSSSPISTPPASSPKAPSPSTSQPSASPPSPPSPPSSVPAYSPGGSPPPDSPPSSAALSSWVSVARVYGLVLLTFAAVV